jgi:hypothetical protein
VYCISPEDVPALAQHVESYLVADGRVLVVFRFSEDLKQFRDETISIIGTQVKDYVKNFDLIKRVATPYQPKPPA